ncbi:Na+/H+ antiporter NhaA [Streptomyces sp. MC1]|uniref:Na+/H+ antiporter NhaA n=1 Tax=unclassified Streptomyces TaxID=2593676 RepID=UPI00068AFB71|nr:MULTISPECIES: Na+/H+ antiporter NhaA [unclassified Streptomyces]KOV95924.1 sodium:proton antiporter [Streptomyces sp. NRRL WC-3723]MBG7697568.1 Na+/H+ antiporter NhaA [Streptomyces sp. MC1]
MAESPPAEFSGQTKSGGTHSPLLAFLHTETGSSALLLAAALAAVVWANVDPSGYESLWRSHLSFQFDTHRLSLPLREWVNSGLMTLFFFVVGLEARREFDMGELRDRKRLALPLAAGVSGMVVPVCFYLAVNSGQPSVHGWGAAMSTDTAFALGTLAVLGQRMPQGLRVFILTIAVVDDFLALGVIAVSYSSRIAWTPLFAALAIFCAAVLARVLRVRRSLVYSLLAATAWVALLKSGVDPVVIGLAMGLLPYAAPASRSRLEYASGLFRLFREQPTPELARSVRAGLASALAPNERLQRLYHPWTSYVVVPLFALANAGIPVSASLLSQAVASPVALGIFFGFLLGKPLGILGASATATWLSRGRVQPPAGWGAVAVGGTLSGAGFTVSLLIAARAFHGPELEQAKAGVLGAIIASFALSWAVTGAIGILPHRARLRALVGKAEAIVDLAVPVDPDRDHVRGPRSGPVTVVEYGDYECIYCGRAEPVIRDLLGSFADVRYVWRHLPLTDVHVHAQLAAEAAEAAASQGFYWQMHDLLITHQGSLQLADLRRYAAEIGLDVERFEQDVQKRVGAARVAEDVESADLSGVAGTPTFFINGLRHHGAYDIDSLSAAVQAARQQTQVGNWRGRTDPKQTPGPPRRLP